MRVGNPELALALSYDFSAIDVAAACMWAAEESGMEINL
jgi:hypothetical protein